MREDDSILGRSLNVLDYDKLNRSALCLELEAELLSDRQKDGRPIRGHGGFFHLYRWWRCIAHEGQREVVVSYQAGIVHDDPIADTGHPSQSPCEVSHGFVREENATVRLRASRTRRYPGRRALIIGRGAVAEFRPSGCDS